MNKDTLELVKTIDLSNDKKLALFTQLLFLIIAVLGGGAVYLLDPAQDNGIQLIFIILSCVGYIVLHELTHIVFMMLFSKQKILIHFKLPYLAVGSNYYFSKRQFIVTALAPFAAFSGLLTALLFVCPKSTVFLLSIVVVLNCAGSAGDFIQVYIVSRLGKELYIQDDSKSTKVYVKKSNEMTG